MNVNRATIASLGLTLLLVVSVLPAGIVGTAHAQQAGGSNWYTVKQGSQCYEVRAYSADHPKMVSHVDEIPDAEFGDFRASDWTGPKTIASIMDYRYTYDPDGEPGESPHREGQIDRYAPYLANAYQNDPWGFGTFGRYDWMDNQESHMFFYAGSQGDSMVIRHDKIYDWNLNGAHDPYREMYRGNQAEGGGTVSFQFERLPQGQWMYLDDMYPPSPDIDLAMDDVYRDGSGNTYGHIDDPNKDRGVREFSGGDFTAHWMWANGGTDGGAYRGLHNLNGDQSVRIDPGFNQDAEYWDEWGPAGPDARTEKWEIRNNTVSDDYQQLIELNMDQDVVIQQGRQCLTSDLDASPDSLEGGGEVTFTASGGGTNYEWDLDGDGTADANTSSRTITHTYNDSGAVNPSVTISAENQSVTATTEVTVESSEAPTAALNVTEGEGTNLPDHHTPGETIVLDASASEDNVALTGQYEWNFGDGASTTGDAVVTHSYGEPGEYAVNVTVTDRAGHTDTVERTVEIKEPDATDPEASISITPSQFEGHRAVSFDASGSSDNRGIVEYRWDFDGDGSIDTPTENATFDDAPYASEGNFTAMVEVVDDNGNTANATVAVNVTAPERPTVRNVTANGMTPSNAPITAGDSVELHANATDNVGVDTYHWDLDNDGRFETTTADDTITPEFDAGNGQNVNLRVSDAAGHNASATVVLDVDPGPNADLQVNRSQVNASEDVLFDARGSTAPSTITEYQWDFDGDGSPEQTTGPGRENATVVHSYGNGDVYDAKVTIVTERDNRNNATATVNVTGEKAADPGNGNGGSSGGFVGGGGGAADPPSMVEEVEKRGANAALVDVRNARGGETASESLPESAVAADTGVSFESLSVEFEDDDSHAAFRTEVSADAPEGTTALSDADEAMSYLRVSEQYLDAELGETNVEFSIQKSEFDGLRTAQDVSLYRYDGGSWEQLDTSVVKETDEAYRLTAAADGLGTFAVGATQSLSVADAKLEATTVVTGGSLEATATVENADSSERTATLDLTLDGNVITERSVTVPAGETKNVTLTADVGEPGTYEVGVGGDTVGTLDVQTEERAVTAVEVTDVALNSSTIAAGESVEITATVENPVGTELTKTVGLTLFGEQLTTKNVTIPAGETKKVTFVQQVDAAGDYTPKVGDQQASLSVTDEGGNGVPSAPGVPGFGVGVTLVALLAAAMLARTRLRG